MTELFKLAGVITVEGLQKAEKDIKKFETSAKKAIAPLVKFGKQAELTGKTLAKNISLPLAAVGGAAGKMAGDFQKAMATSTAIMTDLNENVRQQLSDTAKQISKESTRSASELAQSYYYLASAGLSAEESVGALGKVTKFAEAGQFDLQIATDLLTDAQSALGMATGSTTEKMENMTRVSDVLVKANTLANASVQQFSEAITNRAGAALRILGKDVEEGVAVLAAYADQGTKGAEAGTQLGIVLRDLQKAALNNSGEFQNNSIAVYDTAGEMRNFADVLYDVEQALEGKSDADKKATLSTLGFQEKSIASLMTLIGTSEKIRQYEKDLRSAAGTTEEIARKQMQNLNDQLKILLNRLQVVAINLGETFLPIIEKKIVPAISSFLKQIEALAIWFKDLPSPVQETVFALAAFLAAIGPILIVTGKFIGLIKTLPAAITAVRLAVIALNSALVTNPIILVGAAVVALGVHIYNLEKRYDKLKEAHKSTLKIMTQEEAKREEFTKGMQAVNKTMLENAEVLKDENKLNEILGKDIDNMTSAARALGFEIEGTNTQRLQSLITIDAEIRQLRDQTGALIKYKNEKKDEKEVIQSVSEADKKAMEEVEKANEKARKNRAEQLRKEKEAEFNNKKALKAYDKAIADYRDNMNEQYEKQAAITYEQKRAYLEKEYLEEVKIAEQVGADTLNIAAYYDNELKKLDEQEAKRKADIAKKDKEALIIKMNEINGYVQQTAGIFQGFYDNQAIHIENDYRRRKEAIEQSELDEEEKNKAIENLDKEFTKKRTELQKKQMIADKAAAIFSIGINTASAIVKALPNLLLSGLIGALGAAQAAIVASKPLPELAEGGVIRRSPGGTIVNAAEANEDEGFIPMKKGTASIASAIIDNMNRFAAAGLPAAVAGGAGVTINIGEFIGDERGIQELTRRIIPYINSENRRKGI